MTLNLIQRFRRALGSCDTQSIPPEPVEDLAWPWLHRVYRRLLADPVVQKRAGYAWGMLQAAFLAKHLDKRRITVIEFGVAGGNGLVAMERIGESLGQYLPVAFEIVGFDSAAGLPKPRDYRDLPNLWSAGAYPMDIEKLRSRLDRASLVIGDVNETVETFIDQIDAPVGFISFDLDLYSSTVPAMQLLKARPTRLLPRIHCYFDDIIGYTYGHHNGERLAIRQFNQTNPLRQVSLIYGLRHYLPPEISQQSWVDHKMHMAHVLDHPQYGQWDGLVRHACMDLKEAA